jgi:hypothetical protein
MRRFIIFSFLSLALTANSTTPGIPPEFPVLTENSAKCNLKNAEDDKVQCRAKEEAIKIIRKMKQRYAIASKDSIKMIANHLCEDKNKAECIQSATYSATEERMRIGKAFTKLYQPCTELILKATKTVNEKNNTIEQANQELSEAILKMYETVLISDKGPISDGIQKREITIDDKSSTETIADIDTTDLQKRNGVLGKAGAKLLSWGTWETVTIQGTKYLAKDLTKMHARAIMLATMKLPKILNKSFKSLLVKMKKPPSASYMMLDDVAKMTPQKLVEGVNPFFKYLGKNMARDVVIGSAMYMTFGYLLDPVNSPIAYTIYGDRINSTNSGDTHVVDLEKECGKYRSEIYDKERNHRWYFQCSAMRYYRFDGKSGKFILYSENSDRCTAGDSNTTLFTCQKS